MIRDVTSAFRGVTTPLNELVDRIGEAGWELQKVDFKSGSYFAKAKNPHGETIEKTGPTDATAVANVLVAILRRHRIRTEAQYKIGMWQSTFTDQLQPIAEAYSQLPVYDPKAAQAWKELADDSSHRAQILGQQLKIEVVDEPEPYANVQEMCQDVHQNKRFKVSRANCEHPVWTVDQNVAFRIVHDVMGHCVSGGDFGWQGENLACAAHFPLLSANAQQALFVECIAQTAYAAYYRSFGPQKVGLMPQFLDPSQSQENPAAHTGIHPSQSVAPTAMPQVEGSPPVGLPAGTTAPHEQGIGVWSRRASAALTDPNAGWSSGVEPLPQNAYLDHGDPLEAKAVMDNAAKIDTGWHQMDRSMAKHAIVNAFRVVLLSPRKDLRWNAIHYQDIAHVPSDISDPKTYWDTLDSRRRSWNEAQGFDPDSHLPYFQFIKPFQSIIMQQHPHLSFQEAMRKAEQVLYEWLVQEEQRIAYEDEQKPAEKQRTADEIERRANKALGQRLKAYIKAQFDPRTDQPAHHQPNLFEAAGGQYNLMTGDEAGKYGAFMGTHLKAVARISQHADELLDAALEDVHDHDGTGYHFRAKVLQLGVSGVGPKVASFAWLLLQPLTSQLATIDTHMMDVLGHDTEKEMNKRDYFKFERELQAGRDAAGYSHVPLGAFQWGMWDHKRTGPGSHQDHSAMRVLNPTPHDQIDWASKAVNLKGESWHDQAPDWWLNTAEARQAVTDHWNQNVAPNFPQNKIPWQVFDQTHVAFSKVADTHTFSYWWQKEKPHNVENANKMADYAVGTHTSRERAKTYIEKHKDDVHGSFESFKKKFLKRFDTLSHNSKTSATLRRPVLKHPQTGEEISGLPGQSLMDHAVKTFGWSTPEVWKAIANGEKREDAILAEPRPVIGE